MEKTKQTLRAQVLCGLVLLAMGAVPLVMNGRYLFGSGTEDGISAWLAVAAGLAVIGSGIHLLTGRRGRGEARVLTDEESRRTYALVMSGLCVLLLIGALFVQQPSVSTAVPGLLLAGTFPRLFVTDQNKSG